jgi:hypothetical protein
MNRLRACFRLTAQPPRQRAASLFLLVAAPLLLAAAAPPAPRSGERVALLVRLLQQTAREQDPDAGEPFFAAVEAAFSRAAAGCPLAPARPPIVASAVEQATAAAAEKEAEKRLPRPDEAALQAEADKLFSLLPENTPLTVTYQINPVRQATASGPYRGRQGDTLILGGRKIRLSDIVPAAERDRLAARTDAQAAQAQRARHVADALAAWEVEYRAFLQAEHARQLSAAAAAAVEANEKAGYIRHGDRWLSAPAAVRVLAAEQREALHQAWAVSRPAAPDVGTTPAPPDGGAVTPPPDEGTAATEPTPPSAESATPGTGAVAPDLPVPAAEPPREAGTPDAPGSGGPPAPADARRGVPPEMSPVQFSLRRGGWLPMACFAVGGLLLLVSGGRLLLLLRPDQTAASRFYATRSTAESEFWAARERAAAAGGHVAYFFPDYATAFRAMTQLSFVEQTAPDRPLWARQPIQLGIYMHDHLFVAFVGGDRLTRAMWREAVLALGKAEGSETFKISSAPALDTIIPDLERSPEFRGRMQHVRDYAGERDDFAEYFLYAADNRATAQAFLRLVRVPSEGVHVVVQTPEGHWGRDCQGVYKE